MPAAIPLPLAWRTSAEKHHDARATHITLLQQLPRLYLQALSTSPTGCNGMGKAVAARRTSFGLESAALLLLNVQGYCRILSPPAGPVLPVRPLSGEGTSAAPSLAAPLPVPGPQSGRIRSNPRLPRRSYPSLLPGSTLRPSPKFHTALFPLPFAEPETPVLLPCVLCPHPAMPCGQASRSALAASPPVAHTLLAPCTPATCSPDGHAVSPPVPLHAVPIP